MTMVFMFDSSIPSRRRSSRYRYRGRPAIIGKWKGLGDGVRSLAIAGTIHEAWRRVGSAGFNWLNGLCFLRQDFLWCGSNCRVFSRVSTYSICSGVLDPAFGGIGLAGSRGSG